MNLVYLRNEKKASVVGYKYKKNGRKITGDGVLGGGRITWDLIGQGGSLDFILLVQRSPY